MGPVARLLPRVGQSPVLVAPTPRPSGASPSSNPELAASEPAIGTTPNIAERRPRTSRFCKIERDQFRGEGRAGRRSLTRDARPDASSGTYVYSVVRETPRSFAIEVNVLSGCASRARACHTCSSSWRAGGRCARHGPVPPQALVGALHDQLLEELRERGEDMEDEAAARWRRVEHP